MKVRNLIILGAGIGIGYALAQKMHEDDPDIVKGPRRAPSVANPVLQLASAQAQRVADRASVKSLEAIRRARGAIRERLGDSFEDDAAWN